MHWCLLLKEYSPAIKYIKGERNAVADTLSRLNLHPQEPSIVLQELFGINEDNFNLPPQASHCNSRPLNVLNNRTTT